MQQFLCDIAMFRPALLLTCLGLAACASPQDRCLRDISREAQTVSRLIAETETNLARGFSYEPELQDSYVGVSGCVGTGRYYRGAFGVCGTRAPQVVERPVAIDPAAERRKLDGLRTRQAELNRALPNARAACAAQFGV